MNNRAKANVEFIHNGQVIAAYNDMDCVIIQRMDRIEIDNKMFIVVQHRMEDGVMKCDVQPNGQMMKNSAQSM